MTLGLRLRLSLLARMLVAVAILLPLALVVALLAGVLLALVGLGLAEWAFDGLAIAAAAPRPSAVTGVPPGPIALLSLLGLLGVYWGWPAVRRHTASSHLIPPDGPLSAVGLGWTLGCLYCFLVEGSAAIAALSTTLSSTRGWVVAALLSIALSTIAVVWGARREARRLQDRLVADSVPAADVAPDVGAMTRQLAQLADVPVPDAYVTETDHPESFTVGAGADATVVVSTGLLDALSRDELEAVLAHEVSHLANADSRLMTAALVPVIMADDVIDETPRDPFDRFWNAIFRALKWYGQLGVAILSRGREWGADAGAAALTGAPATLASALARLDDARAAPRTDLREWEASIAAMDVLPPAGADLASGPFRTHPPTADRIDRLRELAGRDDGW